MNVASTVATAYVVTPNTSDSARIHTISYTSPAAPVAKKAASNAARTTLPRTGRAQRAAAGT
jgi:hypothetical protein